MKKLYLLLFLIFISVSIFAQRDSISIAEDLVYNQNFDAAITFYHDIINMDPENPEHRYRLGFCYLNTSNKRDSSITAFKKFFILYNSLSKRKQRKISVTPIEVEFYLARAYRVTYKFDTAISILKNMKLKTKNKKILKLIDDEIILCEDGLKYIRDSVDIQVINLGDKINSKYTEHTPVFTADESELIFTSRKQLFEDKGVDYDNEYDENVYIATKDSLGNYQEPKPIKSINTKSHEATISLSPDGTKLFIYRSEDDGSIYYSEYSKGYWLPTLKLGPNINTRYRETHASLSYDGATLYFTSNRPGGYGGLDIYMSKMLADGTWGHAENLGPGINTPKDEEAPFILPDGVTLYFSSKGHGGMGSYDIFKSHRTDFKTWSKPINLGYPINSIEDDVFFFPTPDEKRAYFASSKSSGYGKTDIYLMKINEHKEAKLIVMTGRLTVCQGKLPNANIIISNLTDNIKHAATPKNGKFIFIVEKNKKYELNVIVKGRNVFNDTICLTSNDESIQNYKTIRLDPEINCNSIDNNIANDKQRAKALGYITINNVLLFSVNKIDDKLKNKTLDTLSVFLIRNPNAIIEVIGYCDASGSSTYNQKLSELRAKSVKKYLIAQGVNNSQIITTGYGEKNPIAINKNKDGSWNKTGQILNRRVEFRIIKQGKEKLFIWQIVIPENLKNPDYNINYSE